MTLSMRNMNDGRGAVLTQSAKVCTHRVRRPPFWLIVTALDRNRYLPVIMKFCSWYGSCAVMACAKFCSNLMPYNAVTWKPIFSRIWITMKKKSWNGAQKRIPAGTRRNNNVFTTSTRRRVDVVMTLSLRHYCVMCPLGYVHAMKTPQLHGHWWSSAWIRVIDQFHKSQNAPVRYPIMLHSG